MNNQNQSSIYNSVIAQRELLGKAAEAIYELQDLARMVYFCVETIKVLKPKTAGLSETDHLILGQLEIITEFRNRLDLAEHTVTADELFSLVE